MSTSTSAPIPIQPALTDSESDELVKLRERIQELEKKNKKKPSKKKLTGLHQVNNFRNKILQLKDPYEKFLARYKNKDPKPDTYEINKRLCEFSRKLESTFDEVFPEHVKELEENPIVRKRKTDQPKESTKKQKS